MASPIENSAPRSLAGLLALGGGPDRVWRPEELGAILQHQMSAVVQFDLAAVAPDLSAKLATLAAADGLLIRSFADLFHHPHPPVELLILTKDFAKAVVNHPDAPLPDQIGRLLYLASIIVALLRCGRRITQLDDAALIDGLNWALAETWLDDPTRAILEEGRTFLTGAHC